MKTRTELLQAQSLRDLTDLCMRFGVEPPGEGERRVEVARRLLAARLCSILISRSIYFLWRNG